MSYAQHFERREELFKQIFKIMKKCQKKIATSRGRTWDYKLDLRDRLRVASTLLRGVFALLLLAWTAGAGIVCLRGSPLLLATPTAEKSSLALHTGYALYLAQARMQDSRALVLYLRRT